MIGVIASPLDLAVLSEFFELFKTPWEVYQRGRQYDVLLCMGEECATGQGARLVVVYGGHQRPCDRNVVMHATGGALDGRMLTYNGLRLPIYGDSVSFGKANGGFLTDSASKQTVAFADRSAGRLWARVGYDLLHEVRSLLTAGQPPANAGIPTLELHISVLRDLIIASGAPLVEISPAPAGYTFIACLTHDVDHPSIQRHKFDHTAFGFLYRAVFRSVLNVLKGRASAGQMWSNWSAAVKLPFVYLGFAKDFWLEFDGYLALEAGAHSSFFAIPFGNDPGMTPRGPAPQRRAARYGAAEIAEQLKRLESEGCEIGLHGINAWFDSAKAWDEVQQIRRVVGNKPVGARMHWLYFNEQSPIALERAGVDYDSTVGYNETIGFRAGTMQAFRPLGATHLLELPLHIMDTALFSSAHMDLSPREARTRIDAILDHAVRFGGAITVNWHDRSIAAERYWGVFYADLVLELKSRGAWLASAAETVAWFRKRRAADFQKYEGGSGYVPLQPEVDSNQRLPGLELRRINR